MKKITDKVYGLRPGKYKCKAGWGPITCKDDTVLGKCEVLFGDPPAPGIVYPYGTTIFAEFTRLEIKSGTVERIPKSFKEG